MENNLREIKLIENAIMQAKADLKRLLDKPRGKQIMRRKNNLPARLEIHQQQIEMLRSQKYYFLKDKWVHLKSKANHCDK